MPSRYLYFGLFCVLAVIDVFSWKIFARPLASKKAEPVRKALISILDSIESPVTQISSDFGGEFISKSTRAYFKQRNIMFKPKRWQQHKAAIAEHSIYLLKSKLYKMMRHYRTLNWVKLLPDVVKLLNAQPLQRNGGIPASEVNSFMDDVKLREARIKNHVKFNEPNREQEIKQESEHEGQIL